MGYVVRQHGLKGDILACLHTKCLPAFPRRVFLERGRDFLGPFEILRIKCFGPSSRKHYLIRFKTSPNLSDTQNKKLSGYSIWVKVRKLPKYTYWVDDLIGSSVFNTDGEKLGVIEQVLRTGANDVYVVGEVLIPALKKIVREVDLKNKKVVVDYNGCKTQD